MSEIEVLLIQAWKLAVQRGHTTLAEAIVSLPGVFVSKPQAKPPEEKKVVHPAGPAGWRIPSGKFRGRSLAQLLDFELQNVWAGFNGCGNTKVANILKAEIDRRR